MRAKISNRRVSLREENMTRKIPRILLIGAGSLGGYGALLLAKMGFDMIVYDDDLVEYHNHRNQIYRERDVDKFKVVALAELIKDLTDVSLKYKIAKVRKETLLKGIVIVMVDSMKVRAEIFQEVKYNPKVRLYIDARSGGHQGQVYAVNPMDPDGIERYEATLYSDKEAEETPCSDQSTLPAVWAITAIVGRFVQRWAEGWTPVCEESIILFEELPSIDSHCLSI